MPRGARYDEVERARTVFEWGPAKPVAVAGPRARAAEEGMSDAELRVPRRAGPDRRATPTSQKTSCSRRSPTHCSPRTSACRDSAEDAEVTIDRESGEIKVWGLELDLEGNVTREWDATPSDFGRIAAQTAKQVLLQIIRDIQRKQMYDEYAGPRGRHRDGIVQQTDSRYTLLDLGKVEALLPQAEQIAYERYDHGAG